MADVLLNDQHALRACFLYEFLQGLKAADGHRNLCHVIGEDTIQYKTVKFWFHRFKHGDYSLEDKPRSGRPRLDVDDDIKQALEEEPRSTVRELSSTLGLAKTTVHEHLIKSGRAPKYGQQIPHDLTDAQKMTRCDLSISLLTRKRTTDWIHNIVTGDEKWCLYVNHSRKRQWVLKGETAKPDLKGELHEKKIMLSIWWDSKGVIYRELLPDRTTITAEVYCRQIQNMFDERQAVRPGAGRMLLLHDNARPHTALMTRQKLQTLDIEVLPHPPYSPDIAPTDYHLFRSLQNSLQGHRFDDRTQLESYLDDFFNRQPPEFYARGIEQLPRRWQEVVDQDGNYIPY